MRVLNLVPNDESRFFQQQVAALADAGVESEILTVPGQREYGDGEESPRSVLDYLRLVPPTIRASFGNFDLVHANSGLTAPHAVVQPSLPVVVSLWGTDLMGEYGWLTRRVVKLADAVVVMSPEMADILDGDCHVIPHGVDLDQFAPASQDAARADLGWDPDADHVLFPYPPVRGVKNYPRAERVVDAVRDRHDGRVELQVITGVPHARMPTYMNAADVLLVTSRREGSPNAVKEAMACNLPVVSTDVGDVRARLADVTPSRVATTDEDLVEGVLDVLRRGECSNGRRAAREVSVDHTSSRLHDVYRDVLAE